MSAVVAGPVWPLVVLLWPLVLALVTVLPGGRGRALWVLPVAPLPGLAWALAGAGGVTQAPGLLLGVTLGATEAGALLMGTTAAIWTAAGWHAARSLAPGRAAQVLAAFWCLTLAGNLGVFLAADVVTFYVAFAAVSLAAWFLVVHLRTDAALHAGRVYIVMAVLGETALLLGLVIAAQGAGSLLIADLRAALPGIDGGGVALALIIVGLGLKAGMVPLHVWLPLAHPAAPVPGSAVLSGAIVKAGLIGLVAFVPGQGAEWAGALLVGLGLAGAFGAALWGLTQTNPKAVLAYSTVSQMGLMLALVGAGQGAVAYYAAHHGLAKGALFLLVGCMMAAAGARARGVVLAVAALLAASVAGIPPLGGALVKAAVKPDLAPWLAQAVGLSAVTTTALLGWFVWRLRALARDPALTLGPLLAGAAALGVAALLLPWGLWAAWTALPPGYALAPAALAEALWPVLAGLGLLAVVRRWPPRARPPGDLLGLLPGVAELPASRSVPGRWVPRAAPAAARTLRRSLARLRRAERRLVRWQTGGALMVALALAGWALMAG